jgi:hypothetical protein
MVNVMELVACNVDVTVNDTPLVDIGQDAWVYPNPAGRIFTFEADRDIDLKHLSVFNVMGQAVKVKYLKMNSRKVQIELSGNLPGVYFVRLKTEGGVIVKKVSYIPWY